MEIIKWIMDNYADLLIAVSGLVGVAEIIVRFTPTEKDDGAVERIGKGLKKVLDFAKIPNAEKKNDDK